MEADHFKVRQLIDMGFNEERARKVLKHFRNELDLAMDYLINTPPEHDHHLITSSSLIGQFVPDENALLTLMEFGY